MALTPVEEFKVGFLMKCAEDGCTREETINRIKKAKLMTKDAFLKYVLPALTTGASILAPLGSAAAVGAIGLPIAAGAGTGYLAAKMTDTQHGDLEDAKQDEVEGEYARLADEAKRNALRKKLESVTGRNVRHVRPSI